MRLGDGVLLVLASRRLGDAEEESVLHELDPGRPAKAAQRRGKLASVVEQLDDPERGSVAKPPLDAWTLGRGSLLFARSALSSTNSARPPGTRQLATRAQKSSKRSGGTCESQNPKKAESYGRSGCQAKKSATNNLAAPSPSRERASSIISGELSRAVTAQPEATRCWVQRPVPQAISSTSPEGARRPSQGSKRTPPAPPSPYAVSSYSGARRR
jgi:hypothetical protein